MLKKIFLTVLFAFSFSLVPLNPSFEPLQVKAVNQVPNPQLDSGGFMFDISAIVNQNIEGSVKQSWIRRGINYFFERIIGAMSAIIGTLCVLVLTVGGFLMLSSAGNEASYEQGKNYVVYGLIGLAVTLSAYILVTLIQLLIRSIYG